jgi:drug/metabolite transporter (DMT)-like permease
MRRQKKRSLLGIVTLVIAVAIASSKDAVFKRLFTHNGAFNACNVLCGSNLIGLVTLPVLFKSDLKWSKVKSVERKEWAVMLFATGLYSVLGPMVYLMGLQMSSVIDAAILSRLESLEFLFLATCAIPNSHLDLWAGINAAIVFVGVASSVVTKPLFGDGGDDSGDDDVNDDVNDSSGGGVKAYFEVDLGDAYIVAGGLCFVGSLLLTKRFLSSVPVGILGMFRVSMGTLVYHTQAVLRNTENNKGYLSADLWENLWWFSLVYVTAFQAVWLYALQNAKSVHISVGTTGIFILSLGWAYAIVPGTSLTEPQLISCCVIGAGVLSGIARGVNTERMVKRSDEKRKMKDELVRESEVGTRGVI